MEREMNWFKIEKIEIAHEDERRSISAIFNGDFTAKQVKILHIKQDSILGNHYHNYRELFYVLSGESIYLLENIETKEREYVILSEGYRLIIQPNVAHRAEMTKGTVMLEATEEPYISASQNDVKYEVK